MSVCVSLCMLPGQVCPDSVQLGRAARRRQDIQLPFGKGTVLEAFSTVLAIYLVEPPHGAFHHT